MSRKAKGTHSRGVKQNTGEIGYALGVLQDLTDMVKAILLELQCPGDFTRSRGKAYQKVVGEVVAHQAG
jgi:hypothetical protein